MMITAMPKVDDRDDNKRDAKKSEDDIDYAEIPAEAKKGEELNKIAKEYVNSTCLRPEVEYDSR